MCGRRPRGAPSEVTGDWGPLPPTHDPLTLPKDWDMAPPAHGAGPLGHPTSREPGRSPTPGVSAQLGHLLRSRASPSEEPTGSLFSLVLPDWQSPEISRTATAAQSPEAPLSNSVPVPSSIRLCHRNAFPRGVMQTQLLSAPLPCPGGGPAPRQLLQEGAFGDDTRSGLSSKVSPGTAAPTASVAAERHHAPPRPVGPAPCVPAAPAQIQSAGFITPTAHLQRTFLAHAHEC